MYCKELMRTTISLDAYGISQFPTANILTLQVAVNCIQETSGGRVYTFVLSSRSTFSNGSIPNNCTEEREQYCAKERFNFSGTFLACP